MVQTAAESGMAFCITDVKKRYDTGSGGFWALKGVSLQADRGEFIALVGKSGSGKSTLLNLLGGIDRQTEGSVTIAGQEIGGMGEDALSRLRGRGVGFIFQFFQLMPTLTALENVMLPMEFLKRIPVGERRGRAEALLARVGLTGQQNKFPQAMSGGEQQRVAIARALANDPGVVLADEPTGNLDSKTSEDIFGLLQALANDGKTVVMVTHNDELAARCGRVVRISDGLIVSDGRTGGAA
jgi:putative ABC transport system ATP-binding protein